MKKASEESSKRNLKCKCRLGNWCGPVGDKTFPAPLWGQFSTSRKTNFHARRGYLKTFFVLYFVKTFDIILVINSVQSGFIVCGSNLDNFTQF